MRDHTAETRAKRYDPDHDTVLQRATAIPVAPREPQPAGLTADLLAATANRATLLITHWLALLAGADLDEVLVLDAGRGVERGTWTELMGRSGGRLRGCGSTR
ncbi:hypothetical protein ACIRYZ_43080 [Kitasatospora sp. NPDC101155]|uniref:hypothetical protein n=1 Tax=Kitasatospora sp. NPDC101155 TaxID=3364097 RepID=UPI00382D7DF6